MSTINQPEPAKPSANAKAQSVAEVLSPPIVIPEPPKVIDKH
jgi:hypothetical protein